METFVPSGKNIEKDRKWHLIDASGKTVGRLATQAATLLMGKNKPTYTPYIDMGDHVVIINAEKIVFTGRKLEDKMYRSHSGWPGGLRETSAQKMLAKHPERIIETAVRRMVPRNRLGRKQMDKLKVYDGPQHPHQAQQPKKLELGKQPSV